MNSSMQGVRLTKAAGWIAAAFGALHIFFALIDRRDTWADAIDEGWWNTFQLDPTTAAEFELSEAFWRSAGSFGVPMLVLGCYVVWSANRRHRVPEWIGWSVGTWGLIAATTLPASPVWALPVIGGLIVFGDRATLASTKDAGPSTPGDLSVGSKRGQGDDPRPLARRPPPERGPASAVE
jgi:hypothetical protein